LEQTYHPLQVTNQETLQYFPRLITVSYILKRFGRVLAAEIE
jgi:hypothetical protein